MSPLLRFLCLATLPALLVQCAAPPRSTAPRTPPSSLGDAARWDRATGTLATAVPTDGNGKAVAWKFSVRPAAGINARSWPDGRVEVTSGTLTFVKNEAELAAVIAHEMAHIFSRHGRERAAASWAVLLGGVALGTIIAAQDGETGTALGVAAGAVLTISMTGLTARQRAQEHDADRVSLDLLRRAGYPPQAAVDFWERYAAHRTGLGLGLGLGRGSWWKAHPPDAERVRRLRELAAAP